MNTLVAQANQLMRGIGVDYAICGGFAIELFLGREIRSHGDIDVSLYWNERDKTVLYMLQAGWQIYEMCGGGMAHRITSVYDQRREKRNLFCMKEGCALVKLSALREINMFAVDFDHSGQKKLDFIEFLFNDKTEAGFSYARNPQITRPLAQAIQSREGVPYLAPELVLLYKSTDIAREGYRQDFDEARGHMTREQLDWLQNALRVMNPLGHPWMAACGD